MRIEYKNFIITPTMPYARQFRFEFVHKDYDGPEDNRFGFAKTVEECMEMIDDMTA